MSERRIVTNLVENGSDLPKDYLKMVMGVFNTHFDEPLMRFKKMKNEANFAVNGGIYPSEIVLSVSLILKKQLAALTVHASVDFDPKASSPTVQDLLGACVDMSATLFDQILNPANPEDFDKIFDASLGALENIPYDWSPVEVDRYKVYLKLDRSNPNIEKMTEEWLNQNDPARKNRREKTVLEAVLDDADLDPSEAELDSDADDSNGGSGTLH